MSTSFKLKRIVGILCAAAGAFILVWMMAQRHSASPEPSPKSSAGPKSGSSEDTSDQRCAGLVENALVMLAPQTLGITSDRETAVSVLNQWLSACAPDVASSPSPNAAWATVFNAALSAEELARLQNPHFTQRDGGHIRDCLWCKTTIGFAVGSPATERDRVVNLFYYVIRNVDLVEPSEHLVPLTPFGVFMLGRGTAEQRAWLFAEFLRQLRIDCVLLHPQQDAENSQTHDGWLVGVLLEDGVYLFDPRLGLPVPSRKDDRRTPLVRYPATLSEVRADTGLLKQFDVSSSETYPLRSTDLEKVQVELIGNTSYWSPRMREFQRALSGHQFVVVYDCLEDSEFGRGLWSRVANVKHGGKALWSSNSLSVWRFPEEQLEANAHLDDAQKKRSAMLKQSLLAPIPIQNVESTKGPDGRPRVVVQFGQPQKLHLKKRTEQVLGDFSAALKGYLLLRLWRDVPPTPEDIYIPPQLAPLLATQIPPEIRLLHWQAAEEAFFRIGVCQFEMGEFGSAATTLHQFTQRFPRSRWTSAARYLWALGLMKQDKKAKAIRVLEATAADAPQHEGFQFLIQRWKSATAPSGQSPSPSPDTK